jgi:hypothetical protein
VNQQTVLDSQAYVSRPDPDRRPYQVVEQWHNDNHPGAFRFCDQQPCHALHRP